MLANYYYYTSLNKSSARMFWICEKVRHTDTRGVFTYDQYANRVRITKPFHIRAMDAAATLNIDYQRIHPYYTSSHPPWMLKKIRPDTEM
jgi:hypothetical protein